MNGILTGLVLSAVPYLLAVMVGVAPAYAGDEVVKKKCIVVAHTGDDADGEPAVVTTGGDGGFHWVSASTTNDEAGPNGAVTHTVRILRRDDDADAKNQGWLGVMISATASGDAGIVTLTNIIPGSPADKAGFQAGDEVVSVDGEAVSGDISRAIHMIKAHEAGDDVTIVVLRDGEEVSLTATLGSRDTSERLAKFEVTVDSDLGGEVEDTIVTRGRMLKRGDDGHWIMTELGDLSELDDLPAHVKMFVPQAGSRIVTWDDNGSSRSIHIEIKGEDSLSISQEDGGDITVTRTDSDGNETVTVYADADELKAGDEAAYRIFNKADANGLGFFVHDGDFGIDDIDFELGDNKFVFSFDDKDFDAAAFEWNENLEKSLSEANASAAEALKNAQALIAELEDGEGWPALDRLHQLQPLIGSGAGSQAFRFHRSKPRHSFEVRADGTIEVKIRKGDTEVVQLFTDADDLADRKPKLYEKYRDVMDAE